MECWWGWNMILLLPGQYVVGGQGGGDMVDGNHCVPSYVLEGDPIPGAFPT